MKKIAVFLVGFLIASVVNAKVIDESSLSNKVKDGKFTAHAIELKPGDTVKLPTSYNSEIVTNPYTSQRFLKIPARASDRGIKKTAIVNAFRYGGRALEVVLDVVSPKTAKYIGKNSGLIADAIDSCAVMLHGEIYQALLSAGVPISYARNIAWAIDAFLL